MLTIKQWEQQMSILSERAKNVRLSQTARVANLAIEKQLAGERIINFSVGEPEYKTPENICTAGIKSIQEGKGKYTATGGLKSLKSAIRDKFKNDNGLIFSEDQTIVCNGGKQVIFNALLSTLNEGDEVIIPAPYWTSYPEMVKLCGGTPVIVPTKIDNNFKLTAQDLSNAITKNTKWVIINSPSNPTGATYKKHELILLSKVLHQHEKIYILSDDIYEKIIYGNNQFCNFSQISANFFSRTLIVNGLSKSHGMTGWRLGYGAGPIEIISSMHEIQSQSTSNACSISQYAGLEALTSTSNEFISKKIQNYESLKNLVVHHLNENIGVNCPEPQGAFYVFPCIKQLIGTKTKTGHRINNDEDFAYHLLVQNGEAVGPGSSFGYSDNFRISYAITEKTLLEGCDQIKKFISSLK